MHTDQHRTEIVRLAKTQNLSVEQFKQLQQLSSIRIEPSTQTFWLKRTLLMLGGMCLGLGIIFFIAANWDNLTNFYRFAMVEGLLATALLLGCLTQRAKPGEGIIGAFLISLSIAYFQMTQD